MLRLNFCVRDGNRWIPQAIVTGNQTEFGFICCRAFLPSGRPRTASRLSLLRFALFASLFAALQPCFPHPQNRTGSSSVPRLTKASHFALLETLSAFSHKPLAPGFSGSRSHWISFARGFPRALPVPCSLFPVPFLSRSSPRPISIIKLHTLPHFHR